MPRSVELSRPVDLRFLHPLALALALAPVTEVALRLYPMKAYLVQWRFQAELGLITLASPLLLGALIAGIVAWASESARLLRVLSVSATLYGLLLMPTVALFVMDGNQMRQMAVAASREAMRNNIMLSAGKGVLFLIAALGFGLVAWRQAAALDAAAVGARAGGTPRNSPSDDDLLVVTGR